MDWPGFKVNLQLTDCHNCWNDSQEWCQMKMNIWCHGKNERTQSIVSHSFMDKAVTRLSTQLYRTLILRVCAHYTQFFREALLYVTIKWVETYGALPELHLSPWWWFILIGRKCKMPPTQNCYIYKVLQVIVWNLGGKASVQAPIWLLRRTFLLLQGGFH